MPGKIRYRILKTPP